MGGVQVTDTERAELKRLAEAATPGPWFVGNWFGRCLIDHKHNVRDCRYTYDSAAEDYRPEGTGISSRTPGRGVVRSGYDGAEIDESDARFIAAANPAAVLDLLAENERLKKAARNVLAHIHDRHAPIQAGDMGIEDPSGINAALDALDDAVEGR